MKKMTQKDNIATLEFENDLMKAVLDLIHEGVYAVTSEKRVVLYNHSTEISEGFQREKVLGRTEDEVYQYLDNDIDFKRRTDIVLQEGKSFKDVSSRYKLPCGGYSYLLYSIYPYYYQGKIAGAITVGRDIHSLNSFISKTLETQKKSDFKVDSTSTSNGTRYFLDDIIGNSPVMQESLGYVRKIAAHDSSILLFGETGTGKELFAHGIHNASTRSKEKFVPINCAAVPETLLESIFFGTVKGAFTGATNMPGLIEQAQGGTVFLDELNSMPLPLQAKLLRVLQDKVVRRLGGKDEISVNCRFICSTNVDPFNAVREGKIRADLFFRLSVNSITIPPLRQRKMDIPLLVHHFLNKYNTIYGRHLQDVSSDFYELLENYSWPGNVRELENIVEACMSWVEESDHILSANHLPHYFLDHIHRNKSTHRNIYVTTSGQTLSQALWDFERECVVTAMQKTKGNVSHAANLLGISRQNLHYRLRRFDLLSENFR